ATWAHSSFSDCTIHAIGNLQVSVGHQEDPRGTSRWLSRYLSRWRTSSRFLTGLPSGTPRPPAPPCRVLDEPVVDELRTLRQRKRSQVDGVRCADLRLDHE